MSGRPAANPAPASLRVEVLKELQQLVDSREARDRIDRGPLAETKGKEHWVLHLTLRALESQQSHVDALVGSAYSNLQARLQAFEDRLARLEELEGSHGADTKTRLEQMETAIGERIDRGMEASGVKLGESLNATIGESLDTKWKPVGDSIETFAIGSKQLLKDVGDTYRVATQTRLLLNENARRLTELGRDIVALEDSLKLVIAKTLEDGLGPLETRVAQLEAHAGITAPVAAPTETSEPAEASEPAEVSEPAEASEPAETSEPAEASEPPAANAPTPSAAAPEPAEAPTANPPAPAAGE
jgi:hypothetical protein